MKLTEQIKFKAFDKALQKWDNFETEHKWIDYIISPVIVALILLTVYALKGVYPFGRNTIAYYDMPTQYVPFYSNAWDILHGKAGLFLCWYYGLGVPGAAGFGQFVLFPTNLFLFFTSRDNILYALSFLLLIKMVLSAFSMSFYCKNKYGLTTWSVCAGILYACCGYVIQYYTNMFFLDYVLLFPIIVWSFERLMTEHKYGIFVFSLSLAFICNFQLSAMVVIYLIIKAYFILDIVPDDMKGRSIRLFALAGIGTALIVAPVLIPSLTVSLGSSRMELNTKFDYFEKLKTVYCFVRRQKQFMMYGGEAAVGLATIMLLKGREYVKKYWKNIIMIFIVGLPILLEGINLLWHFGSYKHFPIRFGYMITFELLIFVCEFLQNEEIESPKIIGQIAKILGVAIIPFVAFVLIGFFEQFLQKGISDISSYMSYVIYFWTLSTSFFIIFLIKELKTRNTALIALCIVQALCGCYGLVGPEVGNNNGSRVKYLLKSIESKKLFDNVELDKTERVKSELLDYEPNYGAVIEHPSIGLWAYGIPSDTERLLTRTMGYHGKNTAVTDEGGTVFSDALLGVAVLLSDNTKDNLLYDTIDGTEGIYRSLYRMPFGIVVEDNDVNVEKESFEFHNALYRVITGAKNELILIKEAGSYLNDVRQLSESEGKEVYNDFLKHLPVSNPANDIIDHNETMDEGDKNDNDISDKDREYEDEEKVIEKEYVLTLDIEGKKSIYLDVDDGFEGELILILNGKHIFFSSYLTENSNAYPNEIYTGIISLGSYEDDTVDLRIYTTNKDLKGINIGLLDLEELRNGIDAIYKNQDLNIQCLKNGLKATGKVNKNGTLFFPVGYSKDWHVKVNGKNAEVKPYINNAFIAVDVTSGVVDVEFWYWPQGLTIGIVLSIVGVVLFIIMNIVIKKGGIIGKKYEKVVDNISIYGFKAVALTVLIVMYVIPIYVKLAL